MGINLNQSSAFFSSEQLRFRQLSPAKTICLSFIIAIFVGGVILALPISHASGHRVGFLDAIFTATSALCVTGLAVVDTGKDYSRFGQVVIMLLCQIGGIGVITLGTLVALFSGRRIGYRERMNLQAQFNSLQVGGMIKLIRRILLLVFSFEAAGFLLLYISFAPREGMGEGAFYALFHSVSAFNNAGFGLYSDNLMQFVGDPIVNFTVMALIIFGGLGFIVEIDVLSYLRHRHNGRKPLLLHTKMVLTATAILILLGTLVFLIFEWNNAKTLGPLSLPTKIMASLFQSVTPRTAGFNTLDYNQMNAGTLMFTILLMFIGGSPGGTAGGIKTVTFFVLVGSAWSISRGQGELIIFGRRLSLDTVVKSGSIALISMVLLGAAVTLLSFTDKGIEPLRLSFEAVSAFGTVGLSTGITATLGAFSKIILILLMYLGRLGPLTLALALVETLPERCINYPAEDIIIG